MLRCSRMASVSLILPTPFYVAFPVSGFRQVPSDGWNFWRKKLISENRDIHNLFLERGERMEIHKIWSESDKYRKSYTSHISVSFVRWPRTWRQADVSWRQVCYYRPQDLFLFLFLFLSKSLLSKRPNPDGGVCSQEDKWVSFDEKWICPNTVNTGSYLVYENVLHI
jgi:hypothetical protein